MRCIREFIVYRLQSALVGIGKYTLFKFYLYCRGVWLQARGTEEGL